MSAEYMAERIADLLQDHDGDAQVGPSVDEDLRSGGYFFDVTHRGREYEVMVVEVRR